MGGKGPLLIYNVKEINKENVFFKNCKQLKGSMQWKYKKRDGVLYHFKRHACWYAMTYFVKEKRENKSLVAVPITSLYMKFFLSKGLHSVSQLRWSLVLLWTAARNIYWDNLWEQLIDSILSKIFKLSMTIDPVILGILLMQTIWCV